MKTRIEWEKAISKLTTRMIVEFPELLKYIQEIPLVDTGKEGVTTKSLKDYYQSLKEIQTKYAKTRHEPG